VTQISRPFQLALALVALVGLVWVFALRGSSHNAHRASSVAQSHVAAKPAKPAPKAHANTGGTPSKIYHGAAPGVQGLTRAIAKAHEAVATSQSNAKKLGEESEKASSTAGGTASSTSSSASTSAPATHSAPSTSATRSPRAAAKAPVNAPGVPARQRAVESELQHGRVVALLFWNKEGADDVAVHNELRLLVKLQHKAGSGKNVQRLHKVFGAELRKPLAVHEAPASQVASFGNVTRGVQVFGTPTLLIIGKGGKTITLTGLQDAFSIEQTIAEVRSSR
jgi:hypothetical protein